MWLGGGWGVDALFGEQTRPHSDLDIVIEQRHVDALCAFLRAAGYADVPRDDTSAWNFVLGDGQGREVDFHVIVLDAAGNGIYGPPERGVMFSAESLRGEGRVGGRHVRCIAAEDQVRSHTGYPLRERDYKDVAALCERFGIAYPDEYRRPVV